MAVSPCLILQGTYAVSLACSVLVSRPSGNCRVALIVVCRVARTLTKLSLLRCGHAIVYYCTSTRIVIAPSNQCTRLLARIPSVLYSSNLYAYSLPHTFESAAYYSPWKHSTQLIASTIAKRGSIANAAEDTPLSQKHMVDLAY